MGGEATEDLDTKTPAAAGEPAKVSPYDFDDNEEEIEGDEETPPAKPGDASSGEKDGQGDDDPPAEGDGKPQEPADGKTGEISEELLGRAKDAGLSEEDAREFGSAKALEKHLTLIGKGKPAEKKEDEAEEIPDLPEDDDYSPEIVKGWKAMKTRLQSLEAENKAFKTERIEHAQAERIRSFDNACDSAGEEYASILGTTKDAHKKDSEFGKNRAKVFDEMHVLAKSYRESGKPIPEEKDLLKRALSNLFGEETQKQARKQIASKIEKRKGSILPRPTNRTTPADKNDPDAGAKSFVKNFFKDKGGAEDEEDEEL